MSELRIDRLRVRVDNAAGHEHRLEPITRRAAALLAEHLARRLAGAPPAAPDGTAHLVAAPVDVALADMSDAAAAERIASAWLAALTPGPASARPPGRGFDRPSGPAGARP